jgi:type VI secretion system protein ImpA
VFLPVIDIDRLSGPISPDEPCGPDLEYDPDYMKLERDVIGVPERQMGATVVPAVPPDWPKLLPVIVGLLERSRDLRIGVYLTRALTATQGLAGLATGLDLLRRMVEGLWPLLHPPLEPGDATFRVSALTPLADREMMLTGVRDTVVVSSRSVGTFRLRDLLAADGLVSGGSQVDPDLVNAAFLSADLQDIGKVTAAVRHAAEQAAAIEERVATLVGQGQAIDLGPLRQLLRQAGSGIDRRIPSADVSTTAGPDVGHTLAESETTAVPGLARAIGGAPSRIASREDAVQAIDMVCAFLEKTEPSSPVPHLLRRARRLIGADFLEIVRDLTPEALGTFRSVSGLMDD